MFELGDILTAVIKGDLNFNRAYIRRRRAEKFRTRSPEQVEALPAFTIDTNRELGWVFALKWLMKRHNITTVHVQSSDCPPLPKELKVIIDINTASSDEILLIIADSMHVSAPPENVICIGLLKEATSHKVQAPFYAIYEMKDIDGLSTPLFKRIGQDHILMPPWMQATEENGLLTVCDLSNPIHQINVALPWVGESPWPTFIRLTNPLWTTLHSPRKKKGALIDQVPSLINPNYHDGEHQHGHNHDVGDETQEGHKHDNGHTPSHGHAHDHGHDHGHEGEHSCQHGIEAPKPPSPRIKRIREILNGLCGYSPERYLENTHPYSANTALNAAFQSIISQDFANIEEEDDPGHAIIIPPSEPFTDVVCWTAGLLAKGWRVGLYPTPETAGLCALVAQLGQDFGLDIDLNSRFQHCDKIIVGDALPPSLEMLENDLRLRWRGKRLSVALVAEATPSLAFDAMLHDGLGPYSPATIFVLDPTKDWIEKLKEALDSVQEALPPGKTNPVHERLKQHRMAIAEKSGQLIRGNGWDLAVLKPEDWCPVPTSRLINVVQIESVSELVELLTPYQPWLHTLGTDLSREIVAPLSHLFVRQCPIGWMQTPSIEARLFHWL